jgi:uncharacterized protein (TIGR02246 family)
MFERYTEKARRAVFSARYEASQCGSPRIETEHLLLGLFREDKALADGLLHERAAVQTIRKEIESQIKINKRISTSVEVPLTPECIHILHFAAEEADLLNLTFVGTEHLLLGILREDKCKAARILHADGLDLAAMKLELARRGATEINLLHGPASVEVKIGQVLEQLVDALAARDAKKLSSFFQEKGQFWDVRGEQWIGPANIEKALGAFLIEETSTRKGNVRDVKYVRVDVCVVTIVWELEGTPEKHRQDNLVMNLVMTQTSHGWSVSSALLAHILPA